MIGRERSTMRSRKEIVSMLKELKAEMASHFGVTQLGLFTPPFFGDAGTSVIVALSHERDILDMAALSAFVREKIGQNIAIFSLNGLRDELKPCILQGEEVTPEVLQLFHKEMIRSVRDIELFCRGMRYEQFLADGKTQQAVFSLLFTLGILSRYLPQEHRDRYPDLPWQALTALPEMLSPCYGTDLRLIWNLVERRLPGLRRSLEALPGMKGAGDQTKRRFF
jgi:uncharacterized protein with HEPN domain